ncbi:hypothetical protein [Pantoea sp. 18069]|uniref:hypothetical protein n=1 Tax=Pantoea sp. 18069 TaxID=2681415 RepID=UPI001357768A|nr:hypothetical protein [Pantoea sp. 18069]
MGSNPTLSAIIGKALQLYELQGFFHWARGKRFAFSGLPENAPSTGAQETDFQNKSKTWEALDLSKQQLTMGGLLSKYRPFDPSMGSGLRASGSLGRDGKLRSG